MAILYKYRRAFEGIRILLTSKIWFSAPSGFEDKSDCQVKYKFTNLLINNKEHAISVADKILSRETPQDYQAIQQFGEEDILKFKNLVMEGYSPEEALRKPLENHIYSDTRVLSLSKRPDIQQMWQRYADNNSGMVIGFKGLTLLYRFPKDVKYSSDAKPCLSWDKTLYDYFAVTPEAKSDIKDFFITKSCKYKWEDEARYIFFVQSEKYRLKNLKSKNKKYNDLYGCLNNSKGVLYPLEKEDIVEVYLGENMNILDKLLIYFIIKFKYPHVKIYENRKVNKIK